MLNFFTFKGMLFSDCTIKQIQMEDSSRRDSTDGKAAALYPEDPGSNPVDSFSMLQRALANNE